MQAKRIHHWSGSEHTDPGHITQRAVKAGWRVRCAGRARCGWHATYLFDAPWPQPKESRPAASIIRLEPPPFQIHLIPKE